MARGRWYILLVLAGLLHAAHPPLRLFTTEDGLVRNWITRIRRDSRGYLWLCTVDGLSIFDGSRFTNFTTSDGLPSRLVNDVLETHDGEYLIATNAGVSRFHLVARDGGGHFENFRIGDAGDANHVSVLLEDSAKTIWCGTGAGLYRLQRSNSEFRAEPVSLNAGRNTAISALLEDPQHRLWAAGDEAFIRQRDGNVFRFSRRDTPRSARAMVIDTKGRVWIGGAGLVGLSLEAEPPAVLARYQSLDGESLNVQALDRASRRDPWIGAPMLIPICPDPAASASSQTFLTSSA